MRVFNTLADLAPALGQELGVSEWHTVTQEQINAFAAATGDEQWIHTDPENAARYSPFQTTIAHGFLTLSLAPKLMASVYGVASVKMGINYGTNSVRFPAPMPSGKRVRMRVLLKELAPQAPNGLRLTALCTFECEDQSKPVCVAELITLLFE
jgi:acyl dehydratase